MPTYYPEGESLNLSERRSLVYTVRNYQDSPEIQLLRSLRYNLFDDRSAIYSACYPSVKNRFERVAVAQEQRTIVVPPRILQEQNDNIGDQFEYDASLSFMREATTSPELTKLEFEQDSLLSVRSLLKTLRSSASLPTTTDRLY